MQRLYQASYKEKFLKTVSTQETYRWLFNRIYEFESKFGKDLFDFNKDQLLEFYEDLNNSISTLQTYNSMVTTYIGWAIGEDLTRMEENAASKIKVNDLKKVAKPDPSVIHVDTIYELVGKNLTGQYRESSGLPRLKNAQDKLLIYLIFLGLGGKAAKELRELKEEHVDRENKLIKLSEIDPERADLVIDDFAIELIDKAWNEDEYLRYIDDTTANIENTKEGYRINEGAEYIFRKSNLGKDRDSPNLSYQGLLARLATMSKYTGEKLTLGRIRKSGIAYVVNLLKEAGVKIDGRGHMGDTVLQKSLFDRFDIKESQRKMSTLREARKHIKEVYSND